ncbi:family 2 glycosyl transferase [Flavobacterium faecale]|uniref:Family 2 glycosyl transferase n=1 Tax=Flavobacterium faecale TaxID=1355330 RepID=A0A2S1LCH7_9FLAO|nr:glycosyltransferase family 2 protein [Flavobacterium faecale]AWG21459.1 family 2 glycosyl transferase [Flavobacterium faecale]
MEVSILIVTKNRPKELAFTLHNLLGIVDLSLHEVLVFIDGCIQTMAIQKDFPWVRWESVVTSVGASPARSILYKNGNGIVFIGLDDDAHPLTPDFISKVHQVFNNDKKIGIVAFQEIKGIFASDEIAIENADHKSEEYYTNDFIGCGFAIKKEVYLLTNGFPVWIDIYGEEACVAIEVLDLGYQIKYVGSIMVNHRVDRLGRIKGGKFYFRFEKQLKNTIYYYLVYLPNPSYKIARLLFHNFKKYGFKDLKYFQLFLKSFFTAVFSFRYILRFRKPVQKSSLEKANKLKGLKY